MQHETLIQVPDGWSGEKGLHAWIGPFKTLRNAELRAGELYLQWTREVSGAKPSYIPEIPLTPMTLKVVVRVVGKIAIDSYSISVPTSDDADLKAKVQQLVGTVVVAPRDEEAYGVLVSLYIPNRPAD